MDVEELVVDVVDVVEDVAEEDAVEEDVVAVEEEEDVAETGRSALARIKRLGW